MSMNARDVIELLGLEPHPAEGGWFRETYRSKEVISKDALDSRYRGSRSVSTAIYYLLDANSVSRLHRLQSDEIFHFYLGDAVEMFMLIEGHAPEIVILGSNIAAGEKVQHLVPRGAWQGARLKPGGTFALLGTTVAPGFDFDDFEMNPEADFASLYPQHAELIRALAQRRPS